MGARSRSSADRHRSRPGWTAPSVCGVARALPKDIVDCHSPDQFVRFTLPRGTPYGAMATMQRSRRGPEVSDRRLSIAPTHNPYRMRDLPGTAPFRRCSRSAPAPSWSGCSLPRSFGTSERALPPPPSTMSLRRRSNSLAVAVATEQAREVFPRARPEFIGLDVYPVVAGRAIHPVDLCEHGSGG